MSPRSGAGEAKQRLVRSPINRSPQPSTEPGQLQKPDLATANDYSNTISVLLGNSNGTFGAKTDFGAGDYPISVAIGDLNGDGKSDLVVANQGPSTVSVLLGSGDGTFGAKTDFGAGNYPISVVIGDLNGDRKPDLTVANYGSNTVSVLLGNGDGSFGGKTDFEAGSNPIFVAIGDLNGDGNPDLAVANYDSNMVSVLLGNGDGNFGAKSPFPTGSLPSAVAIGDLSADGNPDLAVVNRNSNTVSVLLGNGDGTFGAKKDYGTGDCPSSVAIGDLNADGSPDMAVANCGRYAALGLAISSSSNTVVSALLGNGDGTFGTKTDYGTGSGTLSVAIGDLNGDGRLDLAAASDFDMVSVLLNTGTSTTDVAPAPSAPPRIFQLLASRPNPSRGTSEIRFLLPSACTVDVNLFDLAGRKVRSLAAGELSTPGEHALRWDGRDASGAPVRNGVYLVQVRAGREVGVRKLVVLR
jgi:hypothetical protein